MEEPDVRDATVKESDQKHIEQVKDLPVQQLVAQYKTSVLKKKYPLCWRDEMSYTLVKFDQNKKKVYLSLRAQEVLQQLSLSSDVQDTHIWCARSTEYQLLGVPGKSYGSYVPQCSSVEASLSKRRKAMQDHLMKDEAVLSVSLFSRLNSGAFTWPTHVPDWSDDKDESQFKPNQLVTQDHIPFKSVQTLRAENISNNAPVEPDVHSESPQMEGCSVILEEGSDSAATATKSGHTVSGGICEESSGLYVTIQASNLEEAKLLYDHLAVLGPIMLALTASSPICDGHISNYDTMSSVAIDVFNNNKRQEHFKDEMIFKSRHDAIKYYISHLGSEYNDVKITLQQQVFEELCNSGVDDLMSQHISHLLLREPVLTGTEAFNNEQEKDINHLENVLSSSHGSVRLLPPQPNTDIGWRVEFRPMEAQLTDFESAAFAIFVMLLTRVILSFNLDFIIPISKVEKNMQAAFKKDSVLNEKFYFCKDIFADVDIKKKPSGFKNVKELQLMTVNEIFHGKGEYHGLIPLINSYLDSNEVDVDTRCILSHYMRLISLRASGQLETTARWMRHFILNHPNYQQDSVVSEAIFYDLMCRITQISRGENFDPRHLFQYKNKASMLSQNVCLCPQKKTQKVK